MAATRTLVTGLGGLALTTALLAGCGGSSTTQTASSTSAPASSTTAKPPVTPKKQLDPACATTQKWAYAVLAVEKAAKGDAKQKTDANAALDATAAEVKAKLPQFAADVDQRTAAAKAVLLGTTKGSTAATKLALDTWYATNCK